MLKEEQIFHYLIQILTALAYIHSKKIVHRDIKPHNLMLVTSWNKIQQDSIKLIDFGVARQLNGQLLHKRVGSSLFMAPEIFKGNYTEKCDIWAVGIILYIMIMGHSPYYEKKINKGKDLSQYIKNLKCFDFSRLENMKASKLLTELTKEFLNIEYLHRISAYDALQKVFLSRRLKQLKLNGNDINNMLNFKLPLNNLYISILLVIINNFIQEIDLYKISQIFIMFDKKCLGQLSFKCLQQGIKTYINNDEKASEKIAKRIFSNMDLKHHESITYQFFIMMNCDINCLLSDQTIEQIFNQLDNRKKGYIRLKDFEYIFGKEITSNKNWLQCFNIHFNSSRIEYRQFQSELYKIMKTISQTKKKININR